jgi:PAS domain S-box-containing protein
MFSLWHKYTTFVKIRTARQRDESSRADIAYWRGQLFTGFITYLMPTCLIALIPGVIVSVMAGIPVIGFCDVIITLSILVVTLLTSLPLSFRKAFVFLMLYGLAIMLLFFLGSMGPGLLYLFAISVFIGTSLPRFVAYISIAINFVICLVFELIISLKLGSTPLLKQYDGASWVAVSSNLIFLSWISVLLINYILHHLEETNSKEFRLKNELLKQVLEKQLRNQQLTESEGHYRSLFSLNPTPMWVFDAETLQFVQVNEAAIQRYGYSAEEFLRLSLNAVKADKDPTDFMESLLHNLKSVDSLRFLTWHRRKNACRFPVEIICNGIVLKSREAILMIANDITEQINHTKAIENQNAQLLEIAFMQSHILRAPLARLQGLIPLLKSETTTEEEKNMILDYIFLSSAELDEVIKNITDKILPAITN